MNTYRWSKTFAYAALAYLLIICGGVLLSGLADDGVFVNAFISIVEPIPFGGGIAKACVDIFSQLTSSSVDVTEYVGAIPSITPLQFLEDLLELIIASMCYELLSYLFTNDTKHKGLSIGRTIIIRIVVVFFCTLLAPIVMNFIFSHLANLSSFWQWFCSSIFTILVGAGSLLILFSVVFEKKLLETIFYFVLKVVLLNGMTILLTYAAALLVLIVLNEKTYLNIFATSIGYLLFFVLLAWVSIQIDKFFGVNS